MIEKIKYCFAKFLKAKQLQMVCIAVMAAITTVVVTLLSCSTYTVKIFDGEKTYTVRTLNKNISLALSNADLKSENFRIEKTTTKGKLSNVEIVYTFPVYVTCGETTTEVQTVDATVEEILSKIGYTIDEYDFVEPARDTLISKTTYIDFTDISYVNGEAIESIPYTTETVYSGTILKGTVKNLSSGVNGTKKVNYSEKLVNGVSVEKTVVSEEVITAPVNAQKMVGTKVVNAAVTTSANISTISWLVPPSPIALDANGNPVNYTKKLTVQATAYTYTGRNCSTGVAPQPGYIAVNPKVIPYGTKMYIKTPDGRIVYGYAIAADTGGFIKSRPNNVDLFMTTKNACMSFGRRNVEIYILG